MKSIGIVGQGFVGTAVNEGLAKHYNIETYDIAKESTCNSLEELEKKSDIIFVCLPTPMTDPEGGECNLSILENFFKEASSTKTEAIFIIKSTVPVGTTDRMCELYPHMNIVHNPEFLTAANAEYDFVNADRHVIGGDSDLTLKVATLYENVFPTIPVYKMRSKESECVKYFANCFLASKVMVFNEMKMLCDNLPGVSYEKILDGVCSDDRIGDSHTFVPGPDGDYGFGGTCFPKDINSLIHIMKDNGIDPLVLQAVWNQNKNYRQNWDWANNQSAVLGKSETYQG